MRPNVSKVTLRVQSGHETLSFDHLFVFSLSLVYVLFNKQACVLTANR